MRIDPGPSGFRTYTAEALSCLCGAGAGGSPVNKQPGSRTRPPVNRLCSARPRRQRPVSGSVTPCGSSFAARANVVGASVGGVVSEHDLGHAANITEPPRSHCCPRRPRWRTRQRPLARSVADARAALPAADPATASQAFPSLLPPTLLAAPSTHLLIGVLRRPLELPTTPWRSSRGSPASTTWSSPLAARRCGTVPSSWVWRKLTRRPA